VVVALWQRAPALRPFYLYRREDLSGVSGTGVVAIGVVMPSGRAVLEWCSRWPTITVFHSVDQILRIHGHGGRTTVRWGVPGDQVEIAVPATNVPPPGSAARIRQWLSTRWPLSPSPASVSLPWWLAALPSARSSERDRLP
jgi:hypothetical protein